MEYVPYEFCYSVAASLKDSLTLYDAFENPTWNAAAARAAKNRVDCALRIEAGGKCSVQGKDRRNIPFEELQQIEKKNFRVYYVHVASSPHSSPEISEVVHYAHPFVYMADFTLNLAGIDRDYQLHELLSLFKNATFCDLTVLSLSGDDQLSSTVKDFVVHQLQSDSVNKVALFSQDRQSKLHEAVEEYLLNKSYINVQIDLNEKIKVEFFEKLFEKPVTEERSYLKAKFDFSVNRLVDFKKSMQQWSHDRFVWRRVDGVKVTFAPSTIPTDVFSEVIFERDQ